MAMINRRPDFAHGLVHLTKPRQAGLLVGEQWRNPASEFDVLQEILRDGVLHAGRMLVKGDRSVVCFSEAPLSAIQHLIDRVGAKVKLTCYGLVISKRSGYGAGARPVIYLPDTESGWLPSEERWRLVRFEYGNIDHTEEREWRAPSSINLTRIDGGIYVLVRTASEVRQVFQTPSPLWGKISGVLAMDDINWIV